MGKSRLINALQAYFNLVHCVKQTTSKGKERVDFYDVLLSSSSEISLYMWGFFSLCDFIVSLKILMRSNFLFLWLQIKWDKMHSYGSLTQSHVPLQDELSDTVFSSPRLLLAHSSHGEEAASKH